MKSPCIVGLAGSVLGADEAQLLRAFRPAGVILFRRNIRDAEQLIELTKSVQAILGDDQPAIVCADHEGGSVVMLAAAIGRPPSALALGMAEDQDLTRRVHAESARRAAACGVNLLLAPVADVVGGENSVLSTRSFGSSSSAVGSQLRAALRGLRDGGVASCVKHWPGHGRPRADSHLELPTVEASAKELSDRELPPFVEAIEERVDCIMVAHLRVPALDESGAIATVSPLIVRRWLREKLSYRGVILSDALEMQAFEGHKPEDALYAGCDLVIFARPVGELGDLLAGLPEPTAEARSSVQRLRDRFQVASSPTGLSMPSAVYAEARARGAVALWPEARGSLAWPPALANAPGRRAYVVVDAAAGDRLVVEDFDRKSSGQAPSALAQRFAREWGEAAGVVSVAPANDSEAEAARLVSIQAFDAVPVEGLVVASLRPWSAACGLALADLAERCGAAWVLLMGDPSLERRISASRGVLLVPGVSLEDAEAALALIEGRALLAPTGRWGL